MAGHGKSVPKGKLTISIDLELAWGWWDVLTPEILQLAEVAERPICQALLALFERHQIPATWALVAALLDETSARGQPGNTGAWYAPDIIERIVTSKAGHEIGSHGGRHIYYDSISPADAKADIDFAKHVHLKDDLAFDSFVFPRNGVGHFDLLADAGIRIVRGPDVGWTSAGADAPSVLRKLVTFTDKLLPIPPAPARAQTRASLIDLPGSMLLPGRNGLRRFILPWVSQTKLAMGLRSAQRTGSTFHLWFHPSNFYYRREEQLATLAWFLAHASAEAARGNIEICTMGSYANATRGVTKTA